MDPGEFLKEQLQNNETEQKVKYITQEHTFLK